MINLRSLSTSIRVLLILELLVLAFFLFICFGPYQPGRTQPPYRIIAFQAFAIGGTVVSFGLLDYHINCGNAFDNDLSKYMFYTSLKLLPFYMIAVALIVFFGRLLFKLEPYHKWLIISTILLVIIILFWITIANLNITPTGNLDSFLVIMSWLTLIIGSLAFLTFVVQSSKLVNKPDHNVMQVDESD